MSLLILSKPTYISAAAFFRRGGIFISLILLLFLLNSCGLPTYVYMYPPTDVQTRYNPSSSNDYDLIFKNAYENNTSIFSGYEIYYKFYDPLDSETSVSEYISDRTSIDSNEVAGISSLSNQGFSRLYTTTEINSTHNDTKPAFPLETSFLDEEFDIRLLFSQTLPERYYASTYDFTSNFTETPYIYRYVKNSSTNITSKKFFDIDDFDINDSDMPSTINQFSYSDSLPGDYYLYISFYILSYGKDPDDITTSVYSTPVYLGTLKFDAELTNDE